jgi:NifB/MoaA-like Fe-S oxidoreductase
VAIGDWWVVVQKEALIRWVVVEIVDLMIGTYIDGVFVDMHATNAIRDVAWFEEGEEVLVAEVEWVEANIIEVKVLENDVEAFGKLD